MSLQDPRPFSTTGERGALLELAAAVVAADGLQAPAHRLALRRAFEAALEQGEAQALAAAFRQAPDARHYRVLSEALAAAVDTPSVPQGAVIARAFALPVVLVAAAGARVEVAGALSDVGALQALFERSQALGPTRNFGLSNALCALERLEALAPLAVYRAVRDLDPQALNAALPPADITLQAGREQVQLRFLVGAGIGAADAPGFTETAANIGAWGRECARLIGQQLTAPGVQLLALPRPPRDLLSAAYAGRRAQLEVALDLFVSNTLRRFRAAVGDPVAIVSTHDDGDLRLTFSSPFAKDLVEGFRWPLHPQDDLVQLERHVAGLLEDVRLTDLRWTPMVLPARRDDGAVLYPRVDEWERLASGRLAH